MSRVLISGSHGLVGSALAQRLQSDGTAVGRLIRGTSASGDDVAYDPEKVAFDAAAGAGATAIVHLAGAGIADKRWTDERKRTILDSRVMSTRAIATGIAAMSESDRPKVVVSASAIGIYGDQRTGELLDESSLPGRDFLAGVVQRWEEEVRAIDALGVRTVQLRFGIILSRSGGALARLLTPFKLGVGGPIGSGAGHWPVVSRDDVVAAILHAIGTPGMSGAYNVCIPQTPTNREMTKELGRQLHRPTVLPVPQAALRLAFGEMANSLVIDLDVNSARLVDSGFAFAHPTLSETVGAALAD